MQNLQIALVDLHDLSRNGIEMILTRQAQFSGKVICFRKLIDLESALNKQPISILLLDDQVPRTVDLGKRIRQLSTQHPTMSILLLSDKLTAKYVRRMLECGVKGFIYKHDRLQNTLLIGIETVLHGDLYLSPRVSALPYLEVGQDTVNPINARDLDVLRLIAKGHTAKEIAQQLQVDVHTIYRSRRRLKMVLDVRINEQLVDAARDQGLLQ